MKFNSLWACVQLGRPSDSALALVGTYVGARLAGVSDVTLSAVTAVALSNGLLSAASMIFNDWHDVVEDRINRPDRPIPSGRVRRHDALVISTVLFPLAVAVAAPAGAGFAIAAAAVAAASVAYTARIKAVPWGGNLLAALLSSYPLWCWVPFAERPGSLYLTVVLGFFVMGVGREVVRTAFDARGDGVAGVRTVATAWGGRSAIEVGAALMAGALLFGWIPVARHEAGVAYVIMLAVSTAVALAAGVALLRGRQSAPEQSSGRLILVARTIIVLMLLALVGACQSSAGGSQAPTIAVIPRGSTQAFWRAIRIGAERAGSDLKVNVVWPAAFKENDVDAQIAAIEQARALGINAMALAPLDERRLVAPVAELRRAGIPVVIFDSELDGDDYVAEIGTDDLAAGRAAAVHLAARLPSGRVALLRLGQAATSALRREQGFLDEIARHPGLRVVSDSVFTGPLLETAYRRAHELLRDTDAVGGGLDAVFSSNESTTLGALKALEDLGLTAKVRLVGFDRTPRLVNAVSTGEIVGLVLQNPVKIGYDSVATLVDHLRGKPVVRRQWVEFVVADQASLGVPFVRSLLRPSRAEQ